MFPNEKIITLIKALKSQDNAGADKILEDLIRHSEKRGTYKVSKKLREVYALPYATQQTNRRDGSTPSSIAQNGNDNHNLYEIRQPSVSRKNIVLSGRNTDTLNEILTSYKNRKILAEHNIPVESRVLLYGPPGTGKTLFAYVLAGELGVPVMHVNIDMLISSYLGETGKNISKIFEEAAANNCLVLLDEFDAIAKNRDDDLEVGELKRVVTVLLQNLDMLSSDVIIVAATNHDHLLDKAIRRRFAYEINLDYLDQDAREKLIRLFLRDTRQRLDYSLLAQITEGMSGAQIRSVLNRALRKWVFTDKQSKLLDLAVEEILRYVWGRHTVNTQNPDTASKLARTLAVIRQFNAKKYTYRHLEELTSISDATLNGIANRRTT
jgi:SpoVK/Ycf46/Vps4 family AAA+-type ATPase